jgi:TonB family protein
MKTRILFSLCAVAALASLLIVSAVNARGVVPPQGQGNGPKISQAETQALNTINSMTDPAAKLAAVAEFMKKYPKSGARLQIAQRVAEEIAKLKDATQAIALAEKAQTIFTTEPELGIIKTATLDAYAGGNRVDDAFKMAAEMLAKNPEDVHVLVQMTFTGTEEVKQKNPKYVPQSLQYGLKAIELIEANKKPANMDDATWATHKSALPQLYQQTAILYLVGGNSAEAKARLIKSTSLDPTDPSSFALLGLLLNEEYTQLAVGYKAMPEGKPKEETLKKVEGVLDNVIDAYAHAAALGAGRPGYEGMLKQVSEDLTSYYKYRHNQSTQGLQQLIDKYKAPGTAPVAPVTAPAATVTAPATTPMTTPAPATASDEAAPLDNDAISKPSPQYPEIARQANATGDVVVLVTVDETGNVISAKAISGHPLLQAASVTAARQAKFKPLRATGTLTYTFP